MQRTGGNLAEQKSGQNAAARAADEIGQRVQKRQHPLGGVNSQ